MKKRKASLQLPILYIASGLSHFVFMFFGFAVEIPGSLREPIHFLYSIYGSLRFGKTAIGSYLCGMAEQFGQQGKLIFLATLSTVLMLISMLFAAVITVYGAFDLIKKLAHIDMTPTLRDATVDKRAAVSSRVYQFSVLLSFICLLLPCLVNMKTVKGGHYLVLPGLGMLFLLVAVITEMILQSVFRKKKARQQEETSTENVNECPSCQTHVSPGVLFCPMCGTKLSPLSVTKPTAEESGNASEEEDIPDTPKPFQYRKCFGVFARAYDELTEAAERKNIPRRRVSFLTGLCVVLILLSIGIQISSLFLIIPKPTAFEPLQNDIWYSYDEKEKETNIFFNGYILAESISGDVLDVSYALDGNTVVARSYGSKKNSLYLCRGKEVQKISETQYVDYRLSADGSAVAFLNDNYQLVLYKVQSGDTEVIVEKPNGEFTISPDGSALLYRTLVDGVYPLYAYVNGTHTELTSNGIPLGISNEGERIYYFDQELRAVCLRTKSGEVTILAESSEKRLDLNAFFNMDHSEMLFALSGSTYLAKNKTAVKLCDKQAETIGDFEVWGRTIDGTLPIKNFKKLYFLDVEDTLYYLDSLSQVHYVDSSVDHFMYSLTNDVLYYMNKAKQLYRSQEHSPTVCVKVASKVSNFLISPDGQNCYYLDENMLLWHIKHDCKPRLIAGNVLTLTVTNDGLCFFILQDPESKSFVLYATQGVGKIYLIDTDVHVVVANYKRCYYFKAIDYKTYQVYSTTSGIRFREVKRLVQ